jgi:nucleotide-binding universal stress UspA family protein
MMVPHKLLVATDGSTSAQAAEAFACELANSMEACKIVIATVVRPRDLPPTRGGVSLQPLSDTEFDEAKQLVEEAAERMRARLTARTEVEPLIVESRSPAMGIVDAAVKDKDCSMIIIGSRGHGGFGSLVLGSVSTQVVHGAHCPVVVVKG